jgi:plastocyanin
MRAMWYRAARGSVPWVILLGMPWGVSAQGVLDRGPNVEGPWLAGPGTVQFNFVHRFRVTDGPVKKLFNTPSFVLAARVPGNVVAGGRYASSSLLIGGRPNEWELFARWVPVRQDRGLPLDAALQASHNSVANGVDGEVMLSRAAGPLRLLLGGRAYSSFRGGDPATAVVGGAVLRLARHVALAADVGEVLSGADDRTAWGAGVQLGIPYSPHSLSIHVSNVNASTLQGSVSGSSDRRWGFEFTVPITWRRYVGGETGRAAGTAPPGANAQAAVTVEMDNLMNYLPDTVTIAVGQAVRWRNTSDIIHTVTGDPARAELPASVRLPPGARPFDSGDMRPGEEFVHVFTEPGEYRYFCVPHERVGMVGTVIVR